MNIPITGAAVMRIAEPLHKKNTDCLRGLCAVGVLVHHLYQYTALVTHPMAQSVLKALGFLMVAVFFFLSGFGLEVSFRRRGDAYVRALPQQRILPFYLIGVVLILLHAAVLLAVAHPLTWGDFWFSFLPFRSIVINGWYLQVQLLLYLAYYLIWRFFRSDRGRISLLGAALLFYVVLCFLLEEPSYRFVSAPVFLLGVTVGKWQDALLALQRKRPLFLLLGTTAAFVAVFLLWSKLQGVPQQIVQILSLGLFVLFVLQTLSFLPIQNPVTRFLGRLSLEIYVLQGPVMVLLHSRLLYIKNDLIYCLASVAITLLLALLFHPLTEKIHALCKKR